MLHKFRRFLLALVLLVLTPAVLEAQSPQTVDVNAIVSITPFLSCVNVGNFDFGTHFETEGVITSDGSYGALACTTDPGNTMEVTLSLPAVMDNGTGGTVPILYGILAGAFADIGGVIVRYDPTTPVSLDILSGAASWSLGNRGGGPDEHVVSIDLTGAPIGDYTATIVATIAIL